MTERWTQYDRMAEHLAPAAERLVARVAPAAGPILDIGSGSGNGLRSALRVGHAVIGLDRAADQLETAQVVGAPQVLGDATALPFGDGSIAAAISNFGIIFAGDQRAAFDEVARCIGAAGRFAFTAWEPGGWPQATRDALAAHLDRGLPPFPTELGDPRRATSALADSGLRIVDVRHHELHWDVADADAAAEELSEAAGGLRMLRRRLEARDAWDAARPDLVRAVRPHCVDHGDGTRIHDRYVLYVVEASDR